MYNKMSSIFDLKTSVSELSSANDGISQMTYDQIAPSRDITGDNFSNGPQHFRFEVSGQKWWVPSRSYMRCRFKLSKANGAPLELSDNVAPNMAMMPNLYQSGEFRIADKTVSRVSDFMPQIEALEYRLNKSKSWLDSIGKSTNWWEKRQSVRLQQVSVDGKVADDSVLSALTQTQLPLPQAAGTVQAAYVALTGVITFSGAGAANTNVNFAPGDFFVYTAAQAGLDAVINIPCEVLVVNAGLTMTVRPLIAIDVPANAAHRFSRLRPAQDARRIAEFELIWQPPLSLFKVEHGIPAGRFELVLNPQTSTEAARRSIESTLGLASKVPGADFKLECVNMYLEICSVLGPRCDDVVYLLDLEQTRCQTEQLQSDAFSQRTFDVSPSSYALTVAYQDVRCGSNTALSSSKFKSYDAAGNPSAAQELKLDRLFINYAGQNKPAPDADPSFVAGRDYTTQRYVETQIASGGFFDSGGSETIEDYHERGSYYYFPWQRDGSDRSTRVMVNNSFSGADIDNMRCLLFDHSKQVARIKVSQGRVINVDLEEA